MSDSQTTSGGDETTSSTGIDGASSTNLHGEWCTIESDPAVFTEMLESLGCESVELEELYSLDDMEFERLLFQHERVYGLIFLFQWLGNDDKQRQQPSTTTTTTTREPLPEEQIPNGLFFAHQVATNACATQAILSVVLNAGLSDAQLGPILTEFHQFTSEFPSPLKGVAIAGSDDIRKAHNAFGRPDLFFESPTKPRVIPDKDHEAFHFIAYIPKDGVVYELDGLQKGPIIIGNIPASSSNDDNKTADGAGITVIGSTAATVADSWLTVARAAIQERMQLAGETQIKFNLMAVLQDARIPLQDKLQVQPDDMEARTSLETQLQKRELWRLQNQRRRHNYLPACIQMLKELARIGMLPDLIDEAKERQLQKQRAAAIKKSF